MNILVLGIKFDVVEIDFFYWFLLYVLYKEDIFMWCM